MIITFISDTHTLHGRLDSDLPGGDILIHGGDIMNSGYFESEISNFLSWFDDIEGYKHKIFVAGNHDRLFENNPEDVKDLLSYYPDITYLQDDFTVVDGIKIYGSPWQPEFYNWAFNLPRSGKELELLWDKIPNDTHILVTHGPPQGHLDVSGPPYNQRDLGCELLRVKVDEIKPQIHVFGHIHGSYGYKFLNDTHFINASVLDEKYSYVNKPITVDWDDNTNELNVLL